MPDKDKSFAEKMLMIMSAAAGGFGGGEFDPIAKEKEPAPAPEPTEEDKFGLDDEEYGALQKEYEEFEKSTASPKEQATGSKGFDALRQVLEQYGLEKSQVDKALEGLGNLKGVGEAEKAAAEAKFEQENPELNRKQKILTAFGNAFLTFGAEDPGRTGAQLIMEMARAKQERFQTKYAVGQEAQTKAREDFKRAQDRLQSRSDVLEERLAKGSITMAEAQLEMEKEGRKWEHEMQKEWMKQRSQDQRTYYEQAQQNTRKYMDILTDEHLKNLEIDARNGLDRWKQGQLNWRLKEAGEDAMRLDLIMKGVDGATATELAEWYRVNSNGTPPPQHLQDRLSEAQNKWSADKNNVSKMMDQSRVTLWRMLKGREGAFIGGDPNAIDPADQEPRLIFGAEKDAYDYSVMQEYERGLQSMFYQQTGGIGEGAEAEPGRALLDPEFVDTRNTLGMVYRNLVGGLMQTDPQDRAAQRMAQQRITDARDDVVKSDLYDADEKYELLRMMDMIDQDFGLIEQDQISAAEQTLQSVGGMGLQRSH